MKVIYKIFLPCIIPLLFSIQTNGQEDTLTLDDAIQIGLKNNFSIIIAQNDYQIATNNN